MTTLDKTLNAFLGAPKRPRNDPDAKDRSAFARLARKHGLAFRKSGDGYLEAQPVPGFSKGIKFAHYQWGESLDRLKVILAQPALLDEDGYYTE